MERVQTNVQGIPPDKILVVMIDFQNGFCHRDSNTDDDRTLNHATALRANEFARKAVAFGARVIYTQQILDPEKLDPRQREWAIAEGLCEKASWNAELFLDPIPGSIIATKYRYDLWRSSEFLDVLEKTQPAGIIFAGIELCCCVLYAALGTDERGYRYSVPMDLGSGIDPGTDTYNRAVRKQLTWVYGAPQSGSEILKAWSQT